MDADAKEFTEQDREIERISNTHEGFKLRAQTKASKTEMTDRYQRQAREE
jgi:hypothetical protein